MNILFYPKMRIILDPSEQRFYWLRWGQNSKANKLMNANNRSGTLALADRQKNETKCKRKQRRRLQQCSAEKARAQTDSIVLIQLVSPIHDVRAGDVPSGQRDLDRDRGCDRLHGIQVLPQLPVYGLSAEPELLQPCMRDGVVEEGNEGGVFCRGIVDF